MSVRLTPEEKETTIVYSQSPDEQEAMISTADPHMIHRMRRLGIDPERTEMDGSRIMEAEYLVPRSWIRVTPPRKATKGQRESARLAMQALNARRAEARQRPRRRRSAHKER